MAQFKIETEYIILFLLKKMNLTFDYKGEDGYYYNGVHLPDILYIIENDIYLVNNGSLNNLRELLGDNMVNRIAGNFNIHFDNQ